MVSGQSSVVYTFNLNREPFRKWKGFSFEINTENLSFNLSFCLNYSMTREEIITEVLIVVLSISVMIIGICFRDLLKHRNE